MKSLTNNMITSIFLNNIYKIKSRIFLRFFHFKTIKDTLCISTNFKDTGLPTHPCIRNILRFWQFVKKKSWFSFSFCLSRLSSRPVIPVKKRCLVPKLWYVILWDYFTGSPSCFSSSKTHCMLIRLRSSLHSLINKVFNIWYM